MKRVVALLVVIGAFLTTSAYAISDLDVMIEGHNTYCGICAAQELSGEPVINNEKGMATFDLSAKLHDIFFIKNDEVTGFGCVCQDSEQEIEFLAQCITACYNFAGTQAGETCYDAVLSQFMFARSGNALGSSAQVPGLLIELTKESFGYVFMLTRIK